MVVKAYQVKEGDVGVRKMEVVGGEWWWGNVDSCRRRVKERFCVCS